jgi:hypothetical protein
MAGIAPVQAVMQGSLLATLFWLLLPPLEKYPFGILLATVFHLLRGVSFFLEDETSSERSTSV